jgi:mercuric ion binding protein
MILNLRIEFPVHNVEWRQRQDRGIQRTERCMNEQDVSQDQLALFRVEGMHCHKCETDIRGAILQFPGVREVEVDYASGQVSVLFEREAATVEQLADTISQLGYRVLEFTRAHADGD